MVHESQSGGQMERYGGRFFVWHAADLAEKVQRLVAGQFLNEAVELRTVTSHLVHLHVREENAIVKNT